jgi:phenylalanyl-tRNA synthetase beta chain
MRPINNIVDITNFVMLELGHPLHAFDMKHVKGKKVIIQKFENPHEFVTLDGVTRTIHPEDLMICNSDEGMCIAGVFGGFESGVTDDTTAIFLESAYFNPVSVRKTSNRHALKTESSFRFERGTDPSVTVTALKRAALLLKEIAGAEISSPVYDVYPKSIEKAQITFTHEFINVSLGHSIPAETQLSILRDLEFEIISVEEQTVTVLAPYAKVDVTRPADIVEEILRIYGYNNIPFPETHKTGLTFGAKYDEHNIRNIFSEMLTANGFFEIMTNSLSSDRYYSQEFGFNTHENVKLLNPLSNELNTMRRTLLFSGMESVVHNINRKQLDLSFFEFGKVYSCISADKNLQVTNRYNEETHLALLMTGTVFPLNWLYPEEKITFFHLKNQVQQILHRAGISESDINTEETKLPIFSYGLSYSLKKSEKALVHAGEVSRRVLEMTECRQQVFYAEIMWDNLFEFITGQNIQAAEPPRFPEVHRDIALLLDKNIPYSQIRDIIIGKGGKLVKSVRLFDVYEGKNIPEGKKSYAINIILQDSSKTLTDKETDGILEVMKTSFVQTLGAIIR